MIEWFKDLFGINQYYVECKFAKFGVQIAFQTDYTLDRCMADSLVKYMNGKHGAGTHWAVKA